MSSDAPAATSDPHVAAAIARAEQSRAVLDRLTDIGMELAEGLRERNTHAPVQPEPRHEPCRAFAHVSRAVRLTLAFNGRIDMDILAMRKGEAIWLNRPGAGSHGAAPAKCVADAPAYAYPSTLALGPDRVRVRDAVASAINAEFGAFDGAMGALDELHERLVDYEVQDRFPQGSWCECVEAICADLGLEPNWSRWSDEAGFVGPVGKPDVKWDMLWSYDPKRSEQRRRRTAERRNAAAPTDPPEPHARL